MADNYQKMKKVRDEIVNCQKCPLSKYRKENNFLPVVGAGNHNAKIVFVGEAPGLQEAKTGQPFCGSSGKILDELLKSVAIKRQDVYVANILKDKPPQNRDPVSEEILICTPFLEKQIKIIQPKILCPLGRFAMNFLMKKYGLQDYLEPISKIHGQLFTTSKLFGEMKIAPQYHPAVAVYNANMKDILKKDFAVLKKTYNE